MANRKPQTADAFPATGVLKEPRLIFDNASGDAQTAKSPAPPHAQWLLCYIFIGAEGTLSSKLPSGATVDIARIESGALGCTAMVPILSGRLVTFNFNNVSATSCTATAFGWLA